LDGKDLTKMLDDVNLVNAHNASNNAQVIDEVREMFRTKVTDSAKIQHYVIDQKQKLLTVKGDTLVHGTEPASLLTNFVMGLIYMLHMHNYSNDRLSVIGKAVSQSFVEILKKMAEDDTIEKDLFADAQRLIAETRLTLLDTVNRLK
jgi:hypothetical protein